MHCLCVEKENNGIGPIFLNVFWFNACVLLELFLCHQNENKKICTRNKKDYLK
jgi:hypothetical protein